MKILVILLETLVFGAGTTPEKPHNSVNPECAYALLLVYDSLAAKTDIMLTRGFEGRTWRQPPANGLL